MTPIHAARKPTEKSASHSRPEPAGLPSVQDRPSANVVIYDGNCGFCQAQVRRLHRLDGGGRLAFLSLHDPLVAERYPDLSHEQLMEQMYVIDQQGGRHGGAAAFRYLSRKLPRLWLLAPLMHLPFCMPIWQWGYRRVAERRYRWNRQSQTERCDDGMCEVHLKK